MLDRIVVTGASRGLGLALAEECVRAGAKVFACSREKNAALTALEKEFGDRFSWVALDVTEQTSVERAAQSVAAAGGLEMLINNAALGGKHDKLGEVDFDHARAIYEVNVLGALRVSQAFVPLLERGQRPVIVNISSESGSIGRAGRHGEFDYCMSKAALNMQTKLLHNALRARNVHVLSLHPGWVRTDMGGPNAHLEPRESARRVLGVTERHRADFDGPLFLDHEGHAWDW
jgi:NAD(P)-dependent dehydrogenase (short-subunit alcohol dehydrogenase family)